MRILFFDMELPDLLKNSGKTTGGACVRQFAFAKGLIKLGNEVGFITWKGASDYIGNAPLHGLKLVESHPLKGGIRYLRVINQYFYTLYIAVKKYNPEIMIIKGCELKTGFLAIISKIFSIPTVYLVTNDKDADDRYKENTSKPVQLLYSFTVKNATLIVCQNQYQFQQFKMKLPKKDIILLYNPYYPVRSKVKYLPKEKRGYIAWLGVFSYQKNLPLLLQIAKNLPMIPFKIAGSYPSSMISRKLILPETRQAIDSLNKLSNVEFVGFLRREEVVPFLSKAYALLNTSHYEGFSNTFLESFAAGTPIITTREVDPDDIISKNNLGVVVENHEKLITGIEEFMAYSEFESMANHCQEYLIENHSLDNISFTLNEHLTKII